MSRHKETRGFLRRDCIVGTGQNQVLGAYPSRPHPRASSANDVSALYRVDPRYKALIFLFLLALMTQPRTGSRYEPSFKYHMHEDLNC